MFYACGKRASFLSHLQSFCCLFFLQAPRQLRFIMTVLSQNTLYKHNRGILCQRFPLSRDAAVQNTDTPITYCNEGERTFAHQKCCKNVGFFKSTTEFWYKIKYFAVTAGRCWELTSFNCDVRTFCRY